MAKVMYLFTRPSSSVAHVSRGRAFAKSSTFPRDRGEIRNFTSKVSRSRLSCREFCNVFKDFT